MMLQAQEIKYMAAPLSDLSGVTSNSAMRNRMEQFIVSLQVLNSGKSASTIQLFRQKFVKPWKRKRILNLNSELIDGPEKKEVEE